MSDSRPFCMVAFVGYVGIQVKRFRLDMMTLCAAIRFERNPCRCDGCQAFDIELTRWGTGAEITDAAP